MTQAPMTRMVPDSKPIPLRRQQRDFTRQRLVDAARELFVRNGAKATSIDDIAKAAGTSRATFYAHFSDKQDVIRVSAGEIRIGLPVVSSNGFPALSATVPSGITPNRPSRVRRGPVLVSTVK